MSVHGTAHGGDALRGRSSAEIEHDLDRIRGEIHTTLGALADRLSPRELLSRTRARGASALKQLISTGSGWVRTAKSHPVIVTATVIAAMVVIDALLRGRGHEMHRRR